MGLFNKPKQNSLLPEDVEQLLSMALENGEVSEKELNVIYAKAAKHDITTDEIDMIIENRLGQRNLSQKAEEISIPTEEINATIASNCYSATDSIEALFNKYTTLSCLMEKGLTRDQKVMVQNARLVFVNSIETPASKEDVLKMLIHTIPLSKNSTANEAVKTATDIGFAAAKTFGFVGKVATLGLASTAINKAEDLAKKAIMTPGAEIAEAWKNKSKQILDVAKHMRGGLFDKDDEFSSRLKALEKDLDKK